MVYLYKLSFILAVFVLIDPQSALSQPPGLPNAPSQAPIDGGLGLLAVAGGAYALRKLRNRKTK